MRTGRAAVVALAAVLALVAVVVALPGGKHGAAEGPRPSPAAVFRAAAQAPGTTAVTSRPTTVAPVTIPALPRTPDTTEPGTDRAATGSTVTSRTRTAAPTTRATDHPATGRPSGPDDGRTARPRTSSSPSPAGDGPGTTPTRSTSTPAPSHRSVTSSPPRPAPTGHRPTTAASSPPPGTPTATATATAAATPTRTPTGTPTRTPARATASSPEPKSKPDPKPKPTPTTHRPAPPDFGIPVTLGNARQLITVTANSSQATTGTLRAWQRRADGRWTVVHGPYRAWLGSAGIGPSSEYASRTPLGTFTLTEAFGRLANPGTALPYHRTVPHDWWVSDVHSPDYNTLQTCARSDCPFDTSASEHLYYITPYYDYAVVMDVNRWPAVPGRGSAFFLHVTDHAPTAGCVAIDRAALVTVLRWLDPAAHPRIATGIG